MQWLHKYNKIARSWSHYSLPHLKKLGIPGKYTATYPHKLLDFLLCSSPVSSRLLAFRYPFSDAYEHKCVSTAIPCSEGRRYCLMCADAKHSRWYTKKFKSQLFKSFKHLTGTTHPCTMSYHAQGKGPVERLFRKLIAPTRYHENTQYTYVLPTMLLGICAD